MKYLTTYLLASTLFIGELHTFWESDPGLEKYNWIWTVQRPMSIQWNIKYLTDQVLPIIYFIAFFYYGKTHNKVNKTTVLSFLIFVSIDTFMYFYNYKTEGYWKMYLWIPVFWLIIYNWKGKMSDKLWSQMPPFGK